MKHNAFLDGIRGAAVAVVVMFHLHTLLNLGIGKNAAALIAGRLMQLGWLGVDIFFVLSKFLITGIILRERSDRNSRRHFNCAARFASFQPLRWSLL